MRGASVTVAASIDPLNGLKRSFEAIAAPSVANFCINVIVRLLATGNQQYGDRSFLVHLRTFGQRCQVLQLP
ncbi:hypothetical protein [Baaleninema sp.]|uniref:hypothetical protein n=1 Tax=Baaleninema sp. TaxID=3101197 RepID=UPI003CFD9E2C